MNNKKEREGNTQTNLWLSLCIFRNRPFFLSILHFFQSLIPLFLLITFQYSQDFRHEVNLLVKLRHPNVVQFLGAVTDKKPLMLITEYLRGVRECI